MKLYPLLVVLHPAAMLAQPGSIRPADLRCEYLVNPLGIDEREPRLSWNAVAAKPGVRGLAQSAYQVEAPSSQTSLAAGNADLWNSGKVGSSNSAHIAYGGKALASA